MPNTVLGKVSVTPRGPYVSSAQYAALDIVSYDGGSFLALKPAQSVTPGTDPETWMQLASRGEQGETGPQIDDIFTALITPENVDEMFQRWFMVADDGAASLTELLNRWFSLLPDEAT